MITLGSRAPAAFLASFIKAMRADHFRPLGPTLRQDVTDAHNEVCNLLDVENIYEGHPAAHVLPSDPDLILSGNHTLSLFSLNPKTKVQDVLLYQIRRTKQHNLK